MPPVINKEKCVECEECIDNCAHGVFAIDLEEGNVIVSEPENCIGCNCCADECQESAITIKKK